MKKSQKLVIVCLAALGLIIGYIKMRPERQRLENSIDKGVLESKLVHSFDDVSKRGLNVVRYESEEGEKYGVLIENNPLVARDIDFDGNATLEKLITEKILDRVLAGELLGEEHRVDVENLRNPVTSPKNIIGLAYNYAEHGLEVGERKSHTGKNMALFRKELSSLCDPFSDIAKPEGVRLMDYEVELGIVVGKKIDKSTEITPENLSEFIAGYVLTNDISARDIQIAEGSLFDKTKGFRKGKGYPSFCPCGPVFYYTQKGELCDFDLNQFIDRNGRTYQLQAGNSGEMVNSASDIFKELVNILNSVNDKRSRIFINENGEKNYSLEPGDLILTGTPAGTALKFNPLYVVSCFGKKGFVNFEEKHNEKYLRHGNVLLTESFGLGFQKHRIK